MSSTPPSLGPKERRYDTRVKPGEGNFAAVHQRIDALEQRVGAPPPKGKPGGTAEDAHFRLDELERHLADNPSPNEVLRGIAEAIRKDVEADRELVTAIRELVAALKAAVVAPRQV